MKKFVKTLGLTLTSVSLWATSVWAKPIQIGYSAWPGWFPWKVAEEKELFQKNGVEVELVWFDGYLDSLNALAARQLDGNSQTLNDTIGSVANGSDQVIVLTNDNSTGNDAIIVDESIKTIADLKGKKIAAEEGTVDHFLLLLGLQTAGLTQSDISFQPLETGAAAAAFAAGQLDAVGVYAPFTTQALKRANSRILFTSKDYPGAISDHLVFRREVVQNNPQEIQAIVKTWFDTLDYIKANPEESLEIMSKKAGVSISDYQTYDKGTRIFTLEDNIKALENRPQDPTSLPFMASEISKFLVESGLVGQSPDLTKLFDSTFVKAIADQK